MTDLVDEMCEGDAHDHHTFNFGEEMMWTQLDIRARELALGKAVGLFGPVQILGPAVTQQIVFTARAFYDFLTGEHDADPTEQSQ